MTMTYFFPTHIVSLVKLNNLPTFAFFFKYIVYLHLTIQNFLILQQMRLDDAMVKSLIQNRTEFVKLFLDNATDMEEFLDINNLWNIYANVSMTNMFFSH
jgi:hypothetical protein